MICPIMPCDADTLQYVRFRDQCVLVRSSLQWIWVSIWQLSFVGSSSRVATRFTQFWLFLTLIITLDDKIGRA